MLQEGRIEMNQFEHEAVDKLITENPDESVSMTRRDPRDSGPLLVHVGDASYLVDEQGRRRKSSN